MPQTASKIIGSLRRALAFGGGALSAIALTAVIIVALGHRSQHWVRHGREMARVARTAYLSAVDQQTALRGFALTGDRVELGPDAEAEARIHALVDSLIRQTADNPAQQGRAHAIKAALSRWDAGYRTPLLRAAVAAPAPEAVITGAEVLLERQGQVLFTAVRRDFERFLRVEDELYRHRVRVESAVRWAGLAAIFAEVLIVVAVLWRLGRSAQAHAQTVLAQQERLVGQTRHLEDALEAREVALEAALASQSRFRAVVEAAVDAIVTADTAGRIVFWNPGAERMFGYPEETAFGRSLTVLVPERLRREESAGVTHRWVGGGAGRALGQAAVSTVCRADGSEFPAEIAVSDWEAEGERFYTSIIRDVSARAVLEARLVREATHDALTGLLNRAEFRRQVDEALAAVGSPEQVVVLYLDLDDFKAVNDSAGHAVGDELLTTMAARLLSAVRGSDTVARLGGDEFAVLLRDVTRDVEAEIVATRIIGALGGNCQLGERVLRVRASVGLARSEADKGVDMLLRHADMAMYAAKAAGGDRLEWFAPVMHAAALDRAQLEADLLPALERGEFWVAYQPVVSLEDGRVQGAEALVRWTHPERGTISPAQFIPLAEATGHILALGRWVLEEACRAAMTLPGPFTMSVNLSARQLEDVGLADEVRAILARTGLDAGRLMLELTETALMADTERALVQLQALKAMGIRLAVDDFGTGYSSLRYLQQFPVDVLKIDRSFVDRVDRSESDAALVRTIIALGEQLGLRLVAEGIEREAQWRRVQALGCTAGQGYHFARPLPLPELQQWVQRSTAATGSDSGTGRAQPESHGRAAA